MVAGEYSPDLRAVSETAGFNWPSEVMEARGAETRPGESAAILFAWQAQRLWAFVHEEVREATIDALEHTVSGDPSAPAIGRVLLRSSELIVTDATLAALPALSRGAQLLSTPGGDTDSVSTTSLAVGEELLGSGVEQDQACLAEETVAWLGAAVWALCTSREDGRRYIAAWGEHGPSWQEIEKGEKVDLFLLCAYLNDVPFLMTCPELVPYLPTRVDGWFWAGDEQVDRLVDALPEPKDQVPSVSLEDLAGMQDVHEIEVRPGLRFIIGPVGRRGKDFVASALICGRSGMLVLEMSLEQRAGRLWPHLEPPPVGYATQGREADLRRAEARLERLFTERLVASARAARADGQLPRQLHHRAATRAASMFIS